MSKVTPDLTGQRFSRLVAIKRVPGRGGWAWWLCQCDCGQSKAIRANNLVKRLTQSCGCLRRETSAANGRRNEGQARPKVRKKGAGGRPKKAPVVVVQKPAWVGAEDAACELARLWP